MSIINIIFAGLSSIIYFLISGVFKDLAKTEEWAFGIAVPCLIVVTLLFNYIKDKISEKDPYSKLHKATSELSAFKTTRDADIKDLTKSNEIALKELRKKYERHILDLENDISHLNGRLSVKDTIIHEIRNGITNGLIKHGESEIFFQYVKDLATKINSDHDMNTLAPVTTKDTMKYIEMFKKIER